MNARLHVSGGALGGGRMVEDASSVAGVLLGFYAGTMSSMSMSIFIIHLGGKVDWEPFL